MTTCYYCEESEATTTRLGKPTCKECDEKDIRTISDPSKEKLLTDEEKATRLKFIMFLFKHGEEEKRFIKESTDPVALMEWLEKVSEDIICKGSFKVEYEKFIKRWKEVFGNTDNIPQEFKDMINSRFKKMLKI